MSGFETERIPRAALGDFQDVDSNVERDIRLEDYLNDKLQSISDFENLDSLIQAVESQNIQLQKQLQEARFNLAVAKKSSQDHTKSILKRTESFEQHQISIQERMHIVTSSDIPVEAIQRFRGPMEKLRRVELAQAYVELLNDIETLAQEARDHLPNDPKSALRPYTRLTQLVIQLRELQEPADGAGVHLVEYVEQRTSELWREMKKILSDEFEILLNRHGWPNDPQEPSREWCDCFEKLLDLQAPELAAQEPVILLPMSVMARPLIQGFRYHFMGDKETANPNHLGLNIFKWFHGILHKYEEYLSENVTSILSAYFFTSDLAGNTLYIDAVSAFITALLPVIAEKIDDTMNKVSNDPSKVSKLIEEIIRFDQQVRDKYSYSGGNIDDGWKGLIYDVLNKWFDTWWRYEKTFALERYGQIMKAADSGDIDFDSIRSDKTKPTNGAVQVMNLLRIVTDKYRSLRRFSHRTRFLINVQLAIMDTYNERLNDSLSAYQSFTSTVGRRIHGITKEQEAELEGVGGLQSLCKVLGSADYVANALEDLNNDEFFVALWNELQARARSTEVAGSIAGPMTLGEVRDVISSSLGTDEDGGGMLDEPLTAFRAIRDKAEMLIIQTIKYAYPTALRPYFIKPQWTTISSEPVSVDALNVTAELDQPLQMLKEYLAFLRSALAPSALRRIWRECLEGLQDILWNEVLLRQTFTALGAAQLQRDINAIKDVVKNELHGVKGTSLEMPRMSEALALLNLPVDAAEEGLITFQDAKDRCMHDASDAQAVLNDLGLENLSVTDARNILARRVEAMD